MKNFADCKIIKNAFTFFVNFVFPFHFGYRKQMGSNDASNASQMRKQAIRGCIIDESDNTKYAVINISVSDFCCFSSLLSAERSIKSSESHLFLLHTAKKPAR